MTEQRKADRPTDPTAAPADPAADSGRRLEENVGLVATIAGGAFTVLSVAGYELLPSSAWQEKFLIFAVVLALSLTAFTGTGAWRSRRRFAVTASAGGVAIICLAALSIVAADNDATSNNGANLGAPTIPSKTSSSPSVEPSSSTNESTSSTRLAPPSPSVDSSGASPPSVQASQSLINMTPVSGSSSNFAVGPQTVNGHEYQETLYDTTGDDGLCYTDDDYFNLDHKYHNFRATIGLADSTPSADTETFVVSLDNQQQLSLTLSVGQTRNIDINVSGAFRITLQGACNSSSPSDSQVVAVWINPVVN